MTIRSLLAAFALLVPLALGACQTTGSSEPGVTYNPIMSQTAFEGGVVGKKLVSSKSAADSFVIAADNTWGGTWGGSAINGTWKFEDGAFCRTINTGADDCQIFALSSMFDSVKVTRERGNGASYVLKFSM